MQLQRRYNLPNCTLLVDGLADTSGEPGYSQRLAVLMNMDCYLSGQQQPLSGGVDFLTALIQAVSHYAQQCLSGIPHRLAQSSQSPVRIVPLENDRHEIQIYPDPTLAPDPQASTDPQRIPLTTVQFFDLVEAVDQLLADPLTLPQLVVPLSPLSRQENADRVPLIERAATPTLGGLGLALAATAFSCHPPPTFSGLWWIPYPVSRPVRIITMPMPRQGIRRSLRMTRPLAIRTRVPVLRIRINCWI